MTNRYTITFEDETEETVQARVSDSLWAEAQFRKHKAWGKPAESLTLFTNLIAFHAAQRLDLLASHAVTTWEQFTTDVLVVMPVKNDDEEDDDDGPLEVPGLGKGTPAEL